jgi:hypothetical protein
MISYSAIAIGDVIIGLLSQYFKSRKKAMHVFYAITMIGMLLFFTAKSSIQLYLSIGVMGFGTGFWAVFVTIGAENFGTNLRATAATSIPNMVQGFSQWYYSTLLSSQCKIHLRQRRDRYCRSCDAHYVLGDLTDSKKPLVGTWTSMRNKKTL